MKNHRLPLLIAAALLATATLPAPAASMTPSLATITNDFVGKISLNIGGLSVGQPVLVQRFTDVNGNGLIDASQDGLSYSFTVTDGQLPLIGGVRNLNVPGDDDGTANGAIRVDLPFPNVDTVFGRAVGKYVIRLSDPALVFPSVTTVFEVKQKVLPQGVSGQITAAAGGAALVGAFVALAPPDGQPVAAAYSDTSGNYLFNAPPGNYIIYVMRTNYVTDLNAAAVTVTANQFAIKNIALASGGFIISGKISDSSTGAGIPGIFTNADSTNGLFTGAVSDTNGNYSFGVTASQWKISAEGAALAQAGFLGLNSKVITNTAASGSATINFSLPKATALIYGTVKDSNNNPLNGMGVRAQDQGNIYKSEGVAFPPTGSYSVGVLAGTWAVGPDGDALIALGFAGGVGTNVTLNVGQAVQADFVAQGVTAHLRGQLRDDTGATINNMSIVVQPVPFNSSGAGSIYPTSDGSGNFDAGVRAGTWNIALERNNAIGRDYVNVQNFNFTVVDAVDQNGLILVFPRSTFIISGTVKDTLNNPVVGVELDAGVNNNGSGSLPTDASGNYTIKVINGQWNVSVRNNDLSARGYGNANSQSVTVSGSSPTLNFVVQPLPTSIASAGFVGAGLYRFIVTKPIVAGYGYSVQYSTNMKTGTWTTLFVGNPPGSTFPFTDPNATNGFRFYRVTSP